VTPWKNETLWFDRRTDPDELAPIPRPAEGAGLEAELERWASGRPAHPATLTTDPSMIEKLRALGYID
jgi:hypothetical protein